MLTNNEITNLEAYSYKKPSNPGSTIIEQAMKENSRFGEEASVYLNLFSGFKALELEAMYNNINTWEAKYSKSSEQSQQKIFPIKRFFKYVAAAILILSFIPLGYHALNNDMNSEEVFEANFAPVLTQNYYSSRSKAEDNKVNLSKGISAYILEDYPQAIKYLNVFISSEKYKQNSNNSNNIELYLAISYLAEGQVTKAKKTFRKISNKGSQIRQQHTEWYLTLILVKENKVEQAQKSLKSITEEKSHMHMDQAIQLEKQIEELKENNK
jgi:tetratricopeptide (TPR) repeat protein